MKTFRWLANNLPTVSRKWGRQVEGAINELVTVVNKQAKDNAQALKALTINLNKVTRSMRLIQQQQELVAVNTTIQVINFPVVSSGTASEDQEIELPDTSKFFGYMTLTIVPDGNSFGFPTNGSLELSILMGSTTVATTMVSTAGASGDNWSIKLNSTSLTMQTTALGIPAFLTLRSRLVSGSAPSISPGQLLVQFSVDTGGGVG